MSRKGCHYEGSFEAAGVEVSHAQAVGARAVPEWSIIRAARRSYDGLPRASDRPQVANLGYPSPRTAPSRVDDDHDVTVFDQHREGLHPHAGSVERPARPEVELPLVPGALQDLALALEGDPVDLRPDDVGAQSPATERASLVGTDVAHREESAVDVEDPDAPRAADREDPTGARRNFVGPTDDTPAIHDLERSIVFDA